LVDVLVLRGYLERTMDDRDRRKLTVTLTVRGRGAAETQATARKKIDAELVARMGQDDVSRMRRTLAALIDMRRKEEGPEDEH
jgi:DNA-binding MarR family transcriptional regulator